MILMYWLPLFHERIKKVACMKKLLLILPCDILMVFSHHVYANWLEDIFRSAITNGKDLQGEYWIDKDKC